MSKQSSSKEGGNQLFVSKVGGASGHNKNQHLAKVHGAKQGEEKDDPFVQHEIRVDFTKEEVLSFLTEQYNESGNEHKVDLVGTAD